MAQVRMKRTKAARKQNKKIHRHT